MAQPSIKCPKCGKMYRWQTKIAGRTVRCACEYKFRVPMTPDDAVESPEPPSPKPAPRPAAPAKEPDPYELDLPDDGPSAPSAPAGRPASAAGKCPSCNSPIRSGAVICMNCGFNLAEGSKIKTVVDAGMAGPAQADEDPADERLRRSAARSDYDQEVEADVARVHRRQEVILPLVMIGVGIFVALINAFVLAPMSASSADWFGVGTESRAELALAYLIGAGILLALQVPCLFAGLLAIVALLGSAFGQLGSVLRKLIAVALLAGSLYNSVDLGVNIVMGGFGGLGWMFTMSISLAIFWGVIAQLFDDLDVGEIIGLFVAMIIAPQLILIVAGIFFLAA